jgi:hypothetical protein
MRSRFQVALLILVSFVFAFCAAAVWTRTRSPERVAVEDATAVWIAILKGFNGEVRYIGNLGDYEYFIIGDIFWSYYKVPKSYTLIKLPRTFSLGGGVPYVVTLKFLPNGYASCCSASN